MAVVHASGVPADGRWPRSGFRQPALPAAPQTGRYAGRP